MEKPTFNDGKMIKAYIKEKRFFISAMARDMGKQYKTAFNYLKRSSLRTDVLVDISMALRYNFFREMAEQMPPEFPPHYDTDKDEAMKQLQERIKELETENRTLRDALQLIGK